MATPPPPPPEYGQPPPPPPAPSAMKVCLSCGQHVSVHYTVCPYCQKPTTGKVEEPMGAIKYLFYILSFFIPILGIIIGIVLMVSDSKEKKQVGKMCIILAIVAIVLWCLLYFLVFAVWLARWASLPHYCMTAH